MARNILGPIGAGLMRYQEGEYMAALLVEPRCGCMVWTTGRQLWPALVF